jgi:phosphatidate cytidylyltransferase
MKVRIIAGLLALVPVLAFVWMGGVWWAGFMLGVALVAGAEFYQLMRAGGFRPYRLVGLTWLVLIALTFWPSFPLSLSLILPAGLILTLSLALYNTNQPTLNWALTVVGAVYLGVMLGQGIGIRLLPDGFWWLMLALFITWTNDSFAYFTGVTLGRHKIWPRLSPKKSWEGTIGGWIGGALAGWIIVYFSPLTISPWLGAGLGAVGGVLALFGDLSISMLKRQVGAKDTGHILPGHGGALDRLDSLLFVFAFIYQVALWLI